MTNHPNRNAAKFVVVKNSTALGKIVYEGGSHWAPAKPHAKPKIFKHHYDARAMAAGLSQIEGDAATVVDLRKEPMTW